MYEPLVSIVTPSYNQGKFIRQTIESVLQQDYKRIEYIIIDGGSTDDSLDIIREYENRLIYVSERDEGQSDAINKGFKMAQGEIVAWLNSDDVYEAGCITRIVEEFQYNENLGLVYGEGYIINESGKKLRVFEHTQAFDFWVLINFWDFIMQPTAFIRASVIRKVGYLDKELSYCMDWDLWIKLANVSEVKYIDALLACSREYSNTKTYTGRKLRLKEIYCLLRKFSGKKRPLGIHSYKASARYMEYAHGYVLNKIMGRYLENIHKRLFRKLPVRYDDGWIGKEYFFAIPSYIRHISIDYENSIEQISIQEIDVYLNEIKYYEIYACYGDGSMYLNIEKDEDILEVKIRCKKSVVINGRVLSLRVNKITFS